MKHHLFQQIDKNWRFFANVSSERCSSTSSMFVHQISLNAIRQRSHNLCSHQKSIKVSSLILFSFPLAFICLRSCVFLWRSFCRWCRKLSSFYVDHHHYSRAKWNKRAMNSHQWASERWNSSPQWHLPLESKCSWTGTLVSAVHGTSDRSILDFCC